MASLLPSVLSSDTKGALYHTSVYNTAGAALMSFKPIGSIHQHLCAFHCYAEDPDRHVEAHHYCTHRNADMHQCVVYDSDEPNARLIGIEYIISDKLFKELPQSEKKYWHSHKFEIESGLLQIAVKGLVPGFINDAAEQPAMLDLHKTYGKTIHTWAFDEHPDLPLGPPHLMMSYVKDAQIPQDLVKARDDKAGVSTEAKRELRKGYLPLDYEVAEGADAWTKTGKGIKFTEEEVLVKPVSLENEAIAM